MSLRKHTGFKAENSAGKAAEQGTRLSSQEPNDKIPYQNSEHERKADAKSGDTGEITVTQIS